MSGFSCPTCTTDNSRQDRQGVRTASQLEQKYSGVIEGLDLKVEGLSEQSAQITMDVSGLKASITGLAGSQADLELSVNGISANVTSLTGSVNSLAFTVNGLTITDNDGTTRIKGSHIDTSTIATKSITADKLVLSQSITFSDLVSALQNTINTASSDASSAKNTANAANNTANATSTKVNGWSYGGGTYIDGAMIMAGTVMASSLKGGTISVLGSNGSTYGYLYAGTNTANTTAFEVYGATGLRLKASGNVFMQGGSGGNVTCSTNGNVYLANSNETAYLTVNGDGKIYSSVAISVSSDRNRKNSITYDLEAYDAVFDALKPAFYKYNDGTSGRLHGGFIAQDCEDAVLGAGLTASDYALYCKSPVYKLDENGDETNEIEGYDYSVRYSEIVPLNTYEIQKLKKRVKELESRLEAIA